MPDLRPPHGGAAPLDPFFPCARLEPQQPCSAPSPSPPAPPAAVAARSTTGGPGPARRRRDPDRRRSSGASASGDATPTPTPTATAEPGGTTAPSDQSGATGTAPSTEHATPARPTTGTGGTDSGGATAPRRGGLGRQRHGPAGRLRRAAVRGLLRAEPRRLLSGRPSPQLGRLAASSAPSGRPIDGVNPRSREAAPFPTRSPLPHPRRPAHPAPRRRSRRACSVLARASAAAADADGVHAALTNALYDALAVDQVLLVEVAQGAGAGDAHVMRQEGGEDPGYVQVLNDGRPSGTARVVATDAPLHVVDAAGSAGAAPGPRRALRRGLRAVRAGRLGRRGPPRGDLGLPRAPRARPTTSWRWRGRWPTSPRPGWPGSRRRRAPARAPARTRRSCAPRAR